MSEETGEGAQQAVGAQFGKYLIIRRIGQGAFGSVYEAVLPGAMGFSKQVAIKRLRSSRSFQDESFVKALVNEARIGGLLHHANIVDVFEFDKAGHHYYIAMEYIDGVTLSEVVRLCRRRRVLLPRFAVIDVVLQACRGLQYAHEHRDRDGQPLNLIHRDLKPSNIMIDLKGSVKICDFGIAKAASNLFNETATGFTKGTPRYMSPDQLCADPKLLPRSDVFSLAAVLFELITTRPLFSGDSLPALTHQIVFGDIRNRLLEADEALPGCGRVLERALQRDPDERYQDVGSLSEEFRQLSRSYPPEAELSQVIARIMRFVDRTESRAIRGSDELDFDASDTRVFHESSQDTGSEGSAPISSPGPDSSGWTRFTSAFVSTTGGSPTAAVPMNEAARAPAAQYPSDATGSGSAFPSIELGPRPQPAPTRPVARSRKPLLLLVLALGGAFALLILFVAVAYGFYTLGGRPSQGAIEGSPVEPASSDLDPVDGSSEPVEPGTAVDPGTEAEELEAAAEELGVEPDPPIADVGEPATEPVEPVAEQVAPVLEPTPEGGEIRFYVEPWAEITLDGEYKGMGQRPSVPYSVAGGAHTLRLSCTHEGCPEGGREKVFRLWVDGDTMQVDGRPVTGGKNWFCWDFATMARCD